MSTTLESPEAHVLALVTEVGWWIGLAEIRAAMDWGQDYGEQGKTSLHAIVQEMVASGKLKSRGGFDTGRRFEVRSTRK